MTDPSTSNAAQVIPTTWAQRDRQPMEVLLCGCGNAVHTLASLLGNQSSQFRVRILSLSHADRLIPGGEIRCIDEHGRETKGTPSLRTSNPSEAVPGCRVIIFALPADRHEIYLKAMAPYIESGSLIVSCPGEGFFDLCVRSSLGPTLSEHCTIAVFDTLPWVVEYLSLARRCTSWAQNQI